MIIYIKKKNFVKILEGKTIEGRLYKGFFKNLKPNLIITFKSEDKYLDVIITKLKIYNNLDDYLNNENLDKIGPGLSKINIKNDFINCYGLNKINKNRIIAIEFKNF